MHTVMNTGAVKYGLRSIVGFINEILACFVKGWVWFFVEYAQGTGKLIQYLKHAQAKGQSG